MPGDAYEDHAHVPRRLRLALRGVPTLAELAVVRAFVDDTWHVTDRNWAARASLICRPALEYADASPAHFFVTGDPSRVPGAPYGRRCTECERLIGRR